MEIRGLRLVVQTLGKSPGFRAIQIQSFTVLWWMMTLRTKGCADEPDQDVAT